MLTESSKFAKDFLKRHAPAHYLTEPLNLEELSEIAAKNKGRIVASVLIDFYDLIRLDIDELSEIVSELVTDDKYALSRIRYKPLAVKETSIVVQITGEFTK